MKNLRLCSSGSRDSFTAFCVGNPAWFYAPSFLAGSTQWGKIELMFDPICDTGLADGPLTTRYGNPWGWIFPWGQTFKAHLKRERHIVDLSRMLSVHCILSFKYRQTDCLKGVTLYNFSGVYTPSIFIASLNGWIIEPGGIITSPSYQIASFNILRLIMPENTIPVLGHAMVSITVHSTWNSFKHLAVRYHLKYIC